ncbi:WhiB family transcriptional regulator [Pseudofrankia inefficax]|uniref:Transcriptional regulator WhiB n=2 Tax=Frankiaceae TaxID=74712 RepID=E3J246_PSEI1|nr:WhiB family transcriptional regulator [Pseudofrankia inefficax]ADP84151.1 transcription factor WhiB [Pseudofrankia inefficax]
MTDVRRLPGPGAEKWEWQLHGACRGESTELFFHPEGERGPARAAREAAAKAICARCSVIKECGEHALSAREPYGVWGGMSESEREAILTGRTRRGGARQNNVPVGHVANPAPDAADAYRQAPVVA